MNDKIKIGRVLILLGITLQLNLVANGAHVANEQDRPNILLIIADNLGAWQLGCYGNPEIKTPNIDFLAEEGIRFTRSMSVNPVCSPTRASILTGLIPSQHGVHHWLLDENLQTGPDAYCAISEFVTLPEILNEAGYYNGLIGKWHLGDNLHPQEGFEFWTTMPSGLTKSFYNVEVIENGKIKHEPGLITDYWETQVISFLDIARKKQEKDNQPFFLYLSFNGPYSLDPEMLLDKKLVNNRYSNQYTNKSMMSFPRMRPHQGLFKHTKELNNIDAMRATASLITSLDDAIGGVIAELERLDMFENTLVIFTADQGLAGGHNGIWGMGHNTKPSVAYDKVMQIPLIIFQPSAVPAGRTSDIIVNNYDLMPTILDYIGLDEKNPQESPGRSFANVVKGDSLDWDNVTFYEHFYTRAIRTEDWKYVWRYEQPDDLFDLKNDPNEFFNLAEDTSYKDIKSQLMERLEKFFAHYADSRYDIVQGGKSKSWRPPFVEPDFVPTENKTRYYDYD